jgi:hypothetical protein
VTPGVPDDELIILDLNSSDGPVWPALVANGKAFVWNMLHNYGGRRAIYGNAPKIASQPIIDYGKVMDASLPAALIVAEDAIE